MERRGQAGVAARTDQDESIGARVGDEKTELCFDKILRSFTHSSFITLARNRVEVDLKVTMAG